MKSIEGKFGGEAKRRPGSCMLGARQTYCNKYHSTSFTHNTTPRLKSHAWNTSRLKYIFFRAVPYWMHGRHAVESSEHEQPQTTNKQKNIQGYLFIFS